MSCVGLGILFAVMCNFRLLRNISRHRSPLSDGFFAAIRHKAATKKPNKNPIPKIRTKFIGRRPDVVCGQGFPASLVRLKPFLAKPVPCGTCLLLLVLMSYLPFAS
jgi:hypothetical protein